MIEHVEACTIKERANYRYTYFDGLLVSFEMLMGDEWYTPLELIQQKYISNLPLTISRISRANGLALSLANPFPGEIRSEGVQEIGQEISDLLEASWKELMELINE